MEEARLEIESGEVRLGADLREVVNTALKVRSLISGLHTRYNRDVVEQIAIAGALNPIILESEDQAKQAASYVAKRLDAISDETERGWVGAVNVDGGLQFERTVRGVKEVASVDAALIASADARRLDGFASDLQDVYGKPPKLHRKDNSTRTTQSSLMIWFTQNCFPLI